MRQERKTPFELALTEALENYVVETRKTKVKAVKFDDLVYVLAHALKDVPAGAPRGQNASVEFREWVRVILADSKPSTQRFVSDFKAVRERVYA